MGRDLMAMPAKILLVDAAERRGAPRRSLDMDATLRRLSAEPLDAKLHDLSTGGCRVETDAALDLGDELSIGIGGLGMCPARVVRADDRLFGCEFLRPVSREDVAQARAAEVRRLRTAAGIQLEPDGYPEPAPRRWPARWRLAFVLGSATGLWGALYLAARALLA